MISKKSLTGLFCLCTSGFVAEREVRLQSVGLIQSAPQTESEKSDLKSYSRLTKVLFYASVTFGLYVGSTLNVQYFTVYSGYIQFGGIRETFFCQSLSHSADDSGKTR